MASPKTTPDGASVDKFLSAIPDAQMREDSRVITEMMQKAAGGPPKMWGASIVGFGSYQYLNAAGKPVDWMLTAFSPRKQNLVLYLGGLDEETELMAALGKHSCGKGCLYLKRLADVHLPTLRKLISAAVQRKLQR